jgi:hypothetical protein
MKYRLLKQLLLAIAIWLLAVVINTVLGTIYLVAIHFFDAASLMLLGSLYGALFSSPIMIALFIIINRYAAGYRKGASLFNAAFITSVILTVIVFLVFWNMIGLPAIMGLVLQCIAIGSGIISLMIFYGRLVKWGVDLNTDLKL